MLKNYFQNTVTKRKNKETVETIGETTLSEAKKNKKRSTLHGFTPSTISTRLDNFRKYPPAGNWRQIGKINILHTYLLRT